MKLSENRDCFYEQKICVTFLEKFNLTNDDVWVLLMKFGRYDVLVCGVVIFFCVHDFLNRNHNWYATREYLWL